MKRVIKRIRNLKQHTAPMNLRAVEPWETCKTKQEAYLIGMRAGSDNKERYLTVEIESLKKEIEQLKKDRELSRFNIKSRLAEHIGNATNDLSRLMKEI